MTKEYIQNLLVSLQLKLQGLQAILNPPGGLYPKVERAKVALVGRMAALGHPIQVSGTYRSVAAQNALYAQGRTVPGKVVTNARGGQSFHNYRCAFDVVFKIEGYEGPWQLLGAEAEKLGLEWGGRWASFPDHPHCQFTAGYTLADFQQGKVDLDKFN